MKIKVSLVLFLVLVTSQLMLPQSRIKYNNRDIFLNGVNIAWINFSGDIGRGNPNISGFNDIFRQVHNAGGNTLRFWMHTTGSNSPEFNPYTKMVIGPGTYTISDLKKILDAAQANNVGLMLCLWSFDMLRISNGATLTDRAKLMLTDTAYTNAYIRNCLIPMVQALKGHPAIAAWEIFNEPEGMTDEYGWEINYHVPMLNIQRFVNLAAGAIHRTDPNALVTNGCWSMTAQTDIGVTSVAKISYGEKLIYPTEDSRRKIEQEFRQKYGEDLQAEDIVKQYGMRYSVLSANVNQYRDDRLISAGGDSLGKLDFYTVHYYDWDDPNAHSPFHHPCSHWKLDKPLAIAEFFAIDTYGVKAEDLFDSLYVNGYAGAMAWDWNTYAQRTAQVNNMKYLYENFGNDVDAFPVTGRIYGFKAAPSLIEKGDSALIKWVTSDGSKVTLNDVSVPVKGSLYVKPVSTNLYKLAASGDINSAASALVETYPTGKIFAFKATPDKIAAGEKSIIKWNTSRGSSVKLNNTDVKDKDSLEVTLTATTRFSLKAQGDITDTTSVVINIVPALFVNRAVNKPVTASSNSQTAGHDKPSFAIDGDTTSYWTSDNLDAQWLEVDLLNQYEVNKIVIKWGDSYAAKYRIGASLDKTTYQLIANNLNGKSGAIVYDSLKTSARYLKLMLDKRALTSGFSIKEFEVYGVSKDLAAVGSKPALKPETFYLSNNYPNPFNPSTAFEFAIPERSLVNFDIFDILGNKIETIVNDYKEPGIYKVHFEAKNISSGVYYYRMKAGSYIKSGKMLLIK